jgi:endoglucanase
MYIVLNLLKVIKSVIMRIRLYFLSALFLLLSFTGKSQNGFLHTSGKKILNGNGEEVILRGMGMGGWMIQEGYMLETSDFAGPQHEIRKTIENLVGTEGTDDFYNAWLENYCQKKDIDSMAAWGFNSIRLPMHYNLFTLPIEDEPVAGQDTWLNKGFEMVDKLLDWCGENHIYLILDLHGAPGGQGKDANISDYDPSKPSLWESAENRRKTVALWKKLAERYANEPWIGGYDMINEPNWDIDKAGNQNGCSCNQNTALWNLYKDIIRAIRTVDSNHLVIIEGNCWGNNYNGLTNIKSFDSNLVMSFHKYWSYNDVGSIQGIMNLRNTFNVPIWLGESGENSNTWFTNAIKLVESNGIGWAWWPYKKIGSVTGTVTIPKTTGWQNLLNYWKGNGSKPSVETANGWLLEQAEKLKLENCTIHHDVTDAMFRQIQSKESIPFKKHTIPGTVYATDYDLGANGYAYRDADTADYHVTTNTYTAWNSGYAYRNDGVDIEACTDNTGSNGYSVSWTNKGEWLLFTIEIADSAAYSIDIRYAAPGSAGKMHFELDGVVVTSAVSLPATGGWSTWGTKTVQNVVLKKGRHQLKLYIDNAGFNINYFRIHTPIEVGSVTPEILNIKTDSKGEQIRLTSNLGFDLTSLPSAGEFELNVNNSLKNIEKSWFDETNHEILILQTDGSLISNDKILLSYKGNSLKTSGQKAYDPFDNREVENYAPVYFLLPGRIQAEDFNYNNGFQTETCTDLGGGLNLSYANTGDYTDYNVFLGYKGLFRIDYRVAAQASGKFELKLVENDKVTTINSVNVTSTGGWQVWKTLSAEANLNQGKSKLRFYAVSGEFNLNWINVTTITGNELIKAGQNLFACYDAPENTLKIFNRGNPVNKCGVSCFDINGRRLVYQQIEFNGNSGFNMQNISLQRGIYLIRFETSDNVFAQKLRVL